MSLVRLASHGAKGKAESLFNVGSITGSSKKLAKKKSPVMAGAGHVSSTFSIRRG